MNIFVLLLILLLLFGDGGFYFGSQAYGGDGVGMLILIEIGIIPAVTPSQPKIIAWNARSTEYCHQVHQISFLISK